jgi:hypothetical protein
LSQLGYVLIVDYGLSRSLPQPLPMLTHPGRHTKLDSDNGATH